MGILFIFAFDEGTIIDEKFLLLNFTVEEDGRGGRNCQQLLRPAVPELDFHVCDDPACQSLLLCNSLLQHLQVAPLRQLKQVSKTAISMCLFQCSPSRCRTTHPPVSNFGQFYHGSSLEVCGFKRCLAGTYRCVETGLDLANVVSTFYNWQQLHLIGHSAISAQSHSPLH